MKDKCSEIESLEKKGRYDIMYKEARKYEFQMRGKQTQTLTDENNKKIKDEKLMMEKWKKYVEQLYEADKHPENLGIEGTEEVNEENIKRNEEWESSWSGRNTHRINQEHERGIKN